MISSYIFTNIVWTGERGSGVPGLAAGQPDRQGGGRGGGGGGGGGEAAPRTSRHRPKGREYFSQAVPFPQFPRGVGTGSPFIRKAKLYTVQCSHICLYFTLKKFQIVKFLFEKCSVV